MLKELCSTCHKADIEALLDSTVEDPICVQDEVLESVMADVEVSSFSLSEVLHY